jgi:serine phosphatase RsbU (regulator of sigma subunit)
MEQELQAAGKIQRRLLPTGDPEVPEYQITGYNIPCKGVGGDYFDFMPLEGDRMGLAIGDVSGKGMAAALLMATVQASFQAHASAGVSVTELIRRLNAAVARNSMSNKFMTFFYGVLELASGRLIYTNAGHNPPLLFRADGGVEELTGGGMILGVLEDADYTSHEAVLGHGDVLVLFSDGITESQNENEEQFEEPRLMEVVKSCMTETAQEIRGRLEDAVGAFVGKAPQFDDITLMVVKHI